MLSTIKNKNKTKNRKREKVGSEKPRVKSVRPTPSLRSFLIVATETVSHYFTQASTTGISIKARFGYATLLNNENS